MGFKDKLTKYYTDSYMQKYGDRMTQFQGNVISVKVEEKCILWIFHKIQAFLIIKPERSRSIIKCRYRKNGNTRGNIGRSKDYRSCEGKNRDLFIKMKTESL